MNEPSASPGPDPSSRGLHLDSWKEIAAYLKRDIRTAQRWEKQEGLPVHRHQHDERGTAYAYAAEIDRWLETRRRTSSSESVAVAASAVAEGRPAAADVERPPTARSDVSPYTRRTRPRLVPLLRMITALAMVVAAVVFWRGRSDEPARPLSTLSVVFPASERFQEWGPEIALSPDGETLVYGARGLLRVRPLDQLDDRAIPDTAGGWGPFFSPDGRSIGFFEPGRLMKVATGGGAPVVLSDMDVDFIGGADWGRHDQIVYATPTPEGAHGLYRVHASGGRPQLIATLDGHSDAAYWLTPQWIGDGDVILCTVARSSPEGTRFDAVTVSVATGEQQVLLEDARHARDIGGILVYWRNDGLFAVRFDSRRLELTGPHVPAWENVGVRVRNRSWAYAGDTLVYWPNLRTARQLVWVDRQGRQEPLRMPANKYSSPRLSPDGRRIAVIVEGTSSEFGDVWLHDLGTGANVQLTHGSRSGPVAWTPDGASLVVSMRQGGSNDLYRVRADGGEPEGVLVGSSGFLAGAYKQPVGWTEGGLILHQTGMRGRQPRFWAVALDTGSAPRAILTDSTAWAGRVSVDGRWIAYTSGESGRFEVYVARLPEGRPKWRLSGDGGRLPLWARGGRELFYRNGTRMMAVPVTTNGTFVPGEPRQLFEGEFYQVDPGEPHYDVSLDDQRFLVVQRGTTDGPERLNVIQGWRSEIERRLRDGR